ncbi:MAG: L-threonylcarbamoyladenylate synthase [Acidobacteriota bacterium]
MIRVDAAACTVVDLAEACAWIAAGGIVAYPTDTFYGLAVDSTSDVAVAALFDVKGRDRHVAMPLIAASLEQARSVAAVDGASARLAEMFWPGPLSLVLDASRRVAAAIHAGRHTVAVRVPAHRVAQALAEGAGIPITSTSANRSGEPPVWTVDGLADIARDRRVLVVDGGATPGGLPSTIVDARVVPPLLVREGAIAWNRVLDCLNG